MELLQKIFSSFSFWITLFLGFVFIIFFYLSIIIGVNGNEAIKILNTMKSQLIENRYENNLKDFKEILKQIKQNGRENELPAKYKNINEIINRLTADKTFIFEREAEVLLDKLQKIN